MHLEKYWKHLGELAQMKNPTLDELLLELGKAQGQAGASARLVTVEVAVLRPFKLAKIRSSAPASERLMKRIWQSPTSSPRLNRRTTSRRLFTFSPCMASSSALSRGSSPSTNGACASAKAVAGHSI